MVALPIVLAAGGGGEDGEHQASLDYRTWPYSKQEANKSKNPQVDAKI